MPKENISKFFKADTPKEQIEKTIIKALTELRQREKNREMTR
jgi:hypothetical protein